MAAERCPQCEQALPPGARFCAFCGVSLEPTEARATPRDERRVITALFADLAGSTSLGELLDPEDFRDLTLGALGLMGTTIEELGGTVRGTAGDGVLGLFGAPTAHEDDAERAVVVGLKLVERMRGYSADAARRWGVPGLHVRVGIETGPAVLGEVRAGSQVQYDGSGDCLNTAARLEGAADLDGVLVGPVTHRLVGDAFTWGEPRGLALKGKAEEVVGHHALATRGDRSGSRRDAETGTRLVGRDPELAIAREIAADVGAGHSRTVFVTGEAGIGKTRFIREFQALFDADPNLPSPSWLEATCLSYGADEPYLPFRQILRQVLGPALDSPDEVQQALAPLVGRDRAEQLAPGLGMVLGLSPGQTESTLLGSLSGESLQQATIDAVAGLLRALNARGPVAFCVDDLHWADAASLRLTERLISDQTGSAPVLMILALRPEQDRPAWSMRERILRDRPRGARPLDLASLDAEGERGLVADLVGEDTLPEQVQATLLARAEGNPFFLRELLRSLQDAGALSETTGGWQFDPDVAVEIPDTVERVVLARIDRLAPDDRDLLNSAAVIGRTFGLRLLARISGTDLTASSLANLTRLGLVEPATEADFRFGHPLIQETAYLSMLRRGRSTLHARAAAAIEEAGEDGSLEHHATLARHHSKAGQVEEAIKYHRLAAIAAQHIAATEEAVNQLDLALRAATTLDAGRAQALLPELHLLRGYSRGRAGDYDSGAEDLRIALDGARLADNEQVEMQALNELGWLIRVHGYEEAIESHLQALRLGEKLDDPASQVIALSRMSMISVNRLQLNDGLDLAQRALGIARAIGSDRLLGVALDCLKLAALQLGDLGLLEQTTAEIIEVQEREGDVFLLKWAYIERATVPLARGDLEQARDMIDSATAINERFASDRIARAMILEASSWIERAAGDPAAAATAVRTAITTLREYSTPEWTAWLEASLGAHLIELGQVTEAIRLLESALRNSEAIKSPNRAFRAASHLAWARQLTGDIDGAKSALDRAREVLATITAPDGEVFLDGYGSYLAMARTSLAFGDSAAAQVLLDPVIAAAHRHGWRAAEQEAITLLGAAS